MKIYGAFSYVLKKLLLNFPPVPALFSLPISLLGLGGTAFITSSITALPISVRKCATQAYTQLADSAYKPVLSHQIARSCRAKTIWRSCVDCTLSSSSGRSREGTRSRITPSGTFPRNS